MKNHWKRHLTVLVLLVMLAAYVFCSHVLNDAQPAIFSGFIFVFFALVVLFPLAIRQKSPQKVRVVRRIHGRAPPSK